MHHKLGYRKKLRTGLLHIIRYDSIWGIPPGCGCKSNIALTLALTGVKLMPAGNMGPGSRECPLGGHGIQVVRGCAGNVQDIVG